MSENATTVRGTAETVQEFFNRFGAGDRTGMLELFAETTDFEVPGAPTVPWTGQRSTHGQIAEFIRSATEDVATKAFNVDHILVDGQHAVVLGDFAHEVLSTGKVFASRFALHVTVTDGLITTYRMYENSVAAAFAFAG
ncbi:nuclear transport factor 2 family protein [Kitasatospora albolonga]|uniref:nuclear transport factor 2 family protein n=1 Tax=Kitasatospora albolonga TaxID=68173 RepID=UPI0031E74317